MKLRSLFDKRIRYPYLEALKRTAPEIPLDGLFPEPLPKEEQAVGFLTLPSTHNHARTNE